MALKLVQGLYHDENEEEEEQADNNDLNLTTDKPAATLTQHLDEKS
jgi:hypothetical protein